MRRAILNGLAGAALMLAHISPLVQAQETTEQFIPMGYSPGVSGVQSYLGVIAKFDSARKTITVAANNAAHEIKITGRTKIWLDRSIHRAPSVAGGVKDLQKGQRIEIKYEDAKRRKFAEWIKVEAESDRAPD